MGKKLIIILIVFTTLGVGLFFNRKVSDRIGGDYYIKGENIYRKAWFEGEHIVPGADVETFQYVGFYYAKDKSAVYRHSRKINGANPNTFQYVDHQFSKDDKHVFYLESIIKDADPITFVKIDNATYRDKNNTFDSNGRMLKK